MWDLGQAQAGDCRGSLHPPGQADQQSNQQHGEEQHRDEPECQERHIGQAAAKKGSAHGGPRTRKRGRGEVVGHHEPTERRQPHQVGGPQGPPAVAQLTVEGSGGGEEVSGQEEEQRHPPDLQVLLARHERPGVTDDDGGHRDDPQQVDAHIPRGGDAVGGGGAVRHQRARGRPAFRTARVLCARREGPATRPRGRPWRPTARRARHGGPAPPECRSGR